MTQLALDLGPLVTVHCFACSHVVQGSPDGAHDLMEQHYAGVHSALIARLVGPETVRLSARMEMR